VPGAGLGCDRHPLQLARSGNPNHAFRPAGVKALQPVRFVCDGGHALGLRRTKLPIMRWPDLVETWLGGDRDDFGGRTRDRRTGTGLATGGRMDGTNDAEF